MAALYALAMLLAHGLHAGHEARSDEHSQSSACCAGTGLHQTPHTSDCDLAAHPDACPACQVLALSGVEPSRSARLPLPSALRAEPPLVRAERSRLCSTISNRGPPRV